MFGGGGLFSATTQAPTSLFGSTSATSAGLFTSPITSTANPSTGLFGANASQSLGGGSLFGSSNLNAGQKGTVGVKLGLIRDKENLPLACILVMNELAGLGKSLEELRWEDYQLRKAGQVTFKKQASAITGTSLLAPATSAQVSGGLFSNTLASPSTGGLLSTGTGLLTSNTNVSSIGLTTQTNKPTGLFGTASTPSLFSGTPNTATGTTLFGNTQSTAGAANTLQTNTLFGSSVKPAVQTVNTQPLTADDSSLLTPIQSTYTDPYHIKSYFTGKKELAQSIARHNYFMASYDNTTNDWEAKKSKILLQDDEGSSIAKRLQSTKEIIAQSIEKLEKLRISDNTTRPTIAWNTEDEEIIGVNVECKVKKKKVKMLLKIHNSRLIDELKETALKKVNNALKLNIKKEDCKLNKGTVQLNDKDTIQNAEINNNDKLALLVDYPDRSYSTRSSRIVSIILEQSYDSEHSKEVEEHTKQQNKPLFNQTFEHSTKPNRAEKEFSEDDKVDPKLSPILNNKEYKLTPDIAELNKMTEEQLMSVPNFTIENKHGKIVFEGNTNVIGLDLDKIVRIDEGYITVYPEDIEMPIIGKGLNKEATVYLYNCLITSKDKYDVHKRLEKVAKKQKAIHVDYNESNGTWIFRVNHF